MKLRPRIIKGDIVRLSKKGRVCEDFPKDARMLVTDVLGDGIDRSSSIRFKYCGQEFVCPRDELWKTGFNIDNDLELSVDAPLNNNGRTECYVCQMSTQSITLFTSVQQVCANSNCKWFEN